MKGGFHFQQQGNGGGNKRFNPGGIGGADNRTREQVLADIGERLKQKWQAEQMDWKKFRAIRKAKRKG